MVDRRFGDFMPRGLGLPNRRRRFRKILDIFLLIKPKVVLTLRYNQLATANRGYGDVDRGNCRDAQKICARRAKRGLDRRSDRGALAQRGHRQGQSDRGQAQRTAHGVHRERVVLATAAAGDLMGPDALVAYRKRTLGKAAAGGYPLGTRGFPRAKPSAGRSPPE